jgi:hypothetical protein
MESGVEEAERAGVESGVRSEGRAEPKARVRREMMVRKREMVDFILRVG